MYKQKYCLLASAALIAAGIGFGMAGFMAPPPGEISDSMLILVAQCFIAAGSFAGIKVLTNKNSNV